MFSHCYLGLTCGFYDQLCAPAAATRYKRNSLNFLSESQRNEGFGAIADGCLLVLGTAA